ncbi:hypothetical protein EUGRSUZ_H05127 [Eucalyptus grandis]|uniref:Uncharacterized protein n=2 Tax=Eucalyptus grandis TaxID=71139 RepID=A0ACC3JZF7_EUCGR|nr:hypothetical protein EUGRSUZ_H05127 [Eucalyptus grandis]
MKRRRVEGFWVYGFTLFGQEGYRAETGKLLTTQREFFFFKFLNGYLNYIQKWKMQTCSRTSVPHSPLVYSGDSGLIITQINYSLKSRVSFKEIIFQREDLIYRVGGFFFFFNNLL